MRGEDAVIQLLAPCRPVRSDDAMDVIKHLAGIPCPALRDLRLNGEGAQAGDTALEFARSLGDREACSVLTDRRGAVS